MISAPAMTTPRERVGGPYVGYGPTGGEEHPLFFGA